MLTGVFSQSASCCSLCRLLLLFVSTLEKDVLGKDAQGNDIRLMDIWPTDLKKLMPVVNSKRQPGAFPQSLLIQMFDLSVDYGEDNDPLICMANHKVYL